MPAGRPLPAERGGTEFSLKKGTPSNPKGGRYEFEFRSRKIPAQPVGYPFGRQLHAEGSKARILQKKELHSLFPGLTMKAAMRSSWQTETGQLACRWSDEWQRVQYNPPWIRESSESGYVPPVPDFASRSPFAGASWLFLPHDKRESL